MIRRRRAVAALFLCLAAVAAPAAAATRLTAADIAIVKDWAFARCLAKTAAGQPAGDDAAKSAAALLERGHGGMDLYERVETLAQSYAARTRGGSTGSPYGTLRCLDLYHSRALDRLVRRPVARR